MENKRNQKLILYSFTSPSIYSVDYQAPDHTIAEFQMPGKSCYYILGSFNGVVLLLIGTELCLWNPSIRMYKKLKPPQGPQPNCLPQLLRYGLCYDSSVDDFKVVGAVSGPLDYDYSSTVAHVFILN
ncbi:hypothetical protein Vadar_031664 [Vaccinium darrowii]|uniref:Uncharacterized protein n=1 Tax=Vaccinium darrowii TaxID=229202 RepID=A0ACB7YHY1_9ERIC|nr:hypothetical protein Vadar_031664 [Vaccinium darrowii]